MCKNYDFRKRNSLLCCTVSQQSMEPLPVYYRSRWKRFSNDRTINIVSVSLTICAITIGPSLYMRNDLYLFFGSIRPFTIHLLVICHHNQSSGLLALNSPVVYLSALFVAAVMSFGSAYLISLLALNAVLQIFGFPYIIMSLRDFRLENYDSWYPTSSYCSLFW